MKSGPLLPASLALSALLLLQACETISESLGLTRSSPDEFAVVTEPPLTVPPDFQLRPPTPGAPRPQQITPRAEAQRALFDREVVTPSTGSTEAQVLAKAQVDRADPNIKSVVSRETTAIVPKDTGFVDQLMFWNSNKPEAPAESTVLAPEEAKRLRDNQLLGVSPNQGKVPATKDEKPGFFTRAWDWIF